MLREQKINKKENKKKKKHKIKQLCFLMFVMLFLVACGTSEPKKTDDKGKKCKVAIDCKNILNNMELLDEEKKEIVPEDGVILDETEVDFSQGENVYDVLQRVCKEEKILMESSFTVGTSSAYIEGIANLYEFDCGSLSGWQYTVNGEVIGVGCSEYEVQEGDVIAFRYTCDMGEDL